VTRYGMSEKLGSVAYDREPNSFLGGNEAPPAFQRRDYADQTAATIDDEVRGIVERVFQRAQAMLKARRIVLDRAAKRLLEKETLDQTDLEQLLKDGPKEASSKLGEVIGIR